MAKTMAKHTTLLLIVLVLATTAHADVKTVVVAQRAEEQRIEEPKSAEALKKAAEAKKKREAAKANTRKRNAEIEKSVLPMVENHLPDLKVLLDRLRKTQPRLYDTAIRDLAKYSKRLETAKKRSEEAFEVELEVVKALSSANLLIARLRVRDSKKDRESLKKTTQQVHAAELAKIKFDHALLVERLKRMQKQVDASAKRLSDHEAKEADSIYSSYLRKAGIKPNKPSNKQPAPNKDRS